MRCCCLSLWNSMLLAALDKYVEIAKAMKVYKEGMGQEEAARAAVDAVRALSVRVGIPQHLSELGIKESDLDKLATAAIADVCTPVILAR